MKFYVGTSGFSYDPWKGTFYPEDVSAKDMLRYYSSRLPSVEINNTFYKVPKAATFENWAQQVPEHFRFALKASQRITHRKRLKDAASETEYFLRTVAPLGGKLGCVLFQLPPNLRKDLARLKDFLAILPAGTKAAFEFRHRSWFDEDVLQALHLSACALCLSDTEEEPVGEVVPTTTWGYVRLRRPGYDDAALQNWCNRLQSQRWKEAYVFFKHEEEGTGPRLAERFIELSRG
ncbi:MAG: DUF72 domain-containing protein [Acidobacteriota bacterium]